MNPSLLPYHIRPGSEKFRLWIFAFYGYGQHAAVYDELADLCSPRYGFVVFDLPKTADNRVLKKNELKKLFEDLTQQYAITTVIGVSYSMGSRLNLILAETMSQKISKIFLIAPDGIRINPWNRLATGTAIGRSVFSYLMHHPAAYQRILAVLHRVKLLPSPMHTFIKWHVRNLENCMQVLYTWNNMRHMIPNLRKVYEEQLRSGFRIITYFGRNDYIIGEKIRHYMQDHLPFTEINILEKDHNLLDDSLFDDIATYL